MEPTYQLNDFVKDCKMGVSKAIVLEIALKTARSDFNLNTQGQVLGFIGNGGLENPCFFNSKHWEKNPEPKNKIMVDAYNFASGFIYGYIAFFFQPKTDKWIIKSFKKNIEPDSRNFPFKEALSKLQNQH